jgi:hypothetical protein
MAARERAMPENLIASTLLNTNGEPTDQEADADAELNGEGRGGSTTSGRRRRGRHIPTVKGRAHKLTISDDVFERLLYETRKRNKAIDARNRNKDDKDPRITMSALANDILDRTLPTFELTEMPKK